MITFSVDIPRSHKDGAETDSLVTSVDSDEFNQESKREQKSSFRRKRSLRPLEVPLRRFKNKVYKEDPSA